MSTVEYTCRECGKRFKYETGVAGTACAVLHVDGCCHAGEQEIGGSLVSDGSGTRAVDHSSAGEDA